MRVASVTLLKGLCVLFALLGCGCVHTCYLLQAVYGQDEISHAARPIDEVLADESVSPRVRAMLALIEDVKRYGERRGLEPTGNYRHYADLKRPVAVWVVSASQPLRFESRTWWFPIVGTVPYLGWFDRPTAERFAATLGDDGWDVDLRGARAYSTLGWFDDPVLSTMIRDDESLVGGTVNVVLHESVHATHYLDSQSDFNENLADFVADALTIAYLRDHLRLDRWQLYAYVEGEARRQRRERLFHEAYEQLEELYDSQQSDADKLATKARVLAALRSETDFWRPINNATLAGSRTYHGGAPKLAELLAHCDGDWSRFWAVVKRIDGDDFSEPQQADLDPILKPLLAKPCR